MVNGGRILDRAPMRPSLVLAVALVACGDPYATPRPEAATPPPADVAAVPAGRPPAEVRAAGNHLVDAPSPYLQQHARNPIDWYPWSAEALALAKAHGKPIFVSIGYSTCHWCHVMEKESFEDDTVAAFLNAHFVAIKVDREQRPDIDALYLAAVAAMGGDTGWPLNVFLTPAGVPITGGTYFPREPDGRRPGFLALAESVHQDWAARGEAIASDGQKILDALAKQGADGPGSAPTRDDVDGAMQSFARARDDVRGGFGARQKFPNAPALVAALRWSVRGTTPLHAETREHVVTTLERMHAGGLRDAVAGSFHRYCVDPDWRIPHFEKTLYDNAQLASLYLEASQRLQRPDFAEVARRVLDDLLEAWQAPDGGFIVGFDADDANGEGRFYTWTRAELDAALDAAAAQAVVTAYGVEGDPELEGRSVLRLVRGVDAATVGAANAALPQLARVRASRPAPARDDKVLVAWNALAIEALIDGARILDEPRYLDAAIATAKFIETHAVRGDAVRRGVRAGVDLGDGFADDLALFARALLRLHAATGDLAHLRRAHALAKALLGDFWDPQRGGVQRARNADDLPVVTLDMHDQAVPAAGAIAAALWLEVGLLTGDDALVRAGDEVLARWKQDAVDNPVSSGTLLGVMDAATLGMHELVIAGAIDDPRTTALLDAAREVEVDRSRISIARIGAAGIDTADRAMWPALEGKRAQADKPTAYLCTRGSCKMPTSDPAVLRTQLAAIVPPAFPLR